VPIYEFKCEACGALTEVVQRLGDPAPRCSACGSKRTARAVSRTSFHLKGGGWYADLYGTPKPPAAEQAPGKDGTKEATKDAAKEPGKDAGSGAGKEAGQGGPAAVRKDEGPSTPKPGPDAPGGKNPSPSPASRTRRSPAKPRRRGR
jgi:putative FmdB family regulatory protein